MVENMGLGGDQGKGVSFHGPIDPSNLDSLEVIREKIELWKEKALLGKFVGVWPKEKDMVRWI